MRDEFDDLAETIQRLVDSQSVYYLANRGNFGDALIRTGTHQFFQDYGIEFDELSQSAFEWALPFMQGGTVLYGGGGAWCDLWEHSAKIVNVLRRRFQVIVLPSTYANSYHMPGVTFFRRDQFESRCAMPSSFFCHDMAFYLEPESRTTYSDAGYFFRTDAESAGNISHPPINSDISSFGNHLSDIDEFLDVVGAYKIIHTDRLHVGIAGCLLGREVHLYPGSYFKNRAVFRSSMDGYYDNVHFEEL